MLQKEIILLPVFLQGSHAMYVDSSCLSVNVFEDFKLSNNLPKAVSESLHIKIALIVEKRQQKSSSSLFFFLASSYDSIF